MAWFRPKKSAEGPADAGPADEPAPVVPQRPRPVVEAAAPVPAPVIEAPKPVVPEPVDLRTRFDEGTTVEGGVVTGSPMWVGGRIEGDITSRAAVTVAAQGVVVGNVGAVAVRVEPGGAIHGLVTGGDVSVAGIVQGSIRASARLSIAATGRVVGDVSAAAVQVDDGATLQGRCTMARKA